MTSAFTEVRVLGPIEVLHRAKALALPGPREKALLGLLAARAPRPVPVEQLLEDLWGDHPPAGSAITLRSYVSTLRRALKKGGVDDLIETHPGSYGLVPGSRPNIDALLFEALLDQARRHHLAGSTGPEAATLRACLNLWRGAPFGEVGTVASLVPYRVRLEQLHLLALERWADAELANGRHQELGPELAAICEEHPLRERFWAQRMVALYRSGSQAEALDVYQKVRGILRDNLGVVPGADLRAVDAAILRQDPSLDRAVPAASAPTNFAGAQLLATRGAFCGRRFELDALQASWAMALAGPGQLVLVAGEPGIGKTRLLAEWAARAHAQGVSVLYARCDQDAGRPYQCFVDALSPWLRQAPNDLLGDMTSDERPELAALFPELARRCLSGGVLAPIDPETARLHLFDAFAGLVTGASARQPMVIILDDLHWADASSLMMLRHLSRHLGPGGLLVVGSHRHSGLSTLPLVSTVDDLARDPGFTSLELAGLSADEVVALVAESSPLNSRADLAQLGVVLHQATAGNPLFVRQMVSHLSTAPDEYFAADGAMLVEPPLPVGVRDVIGRRLSSLSPFTLDVLSTAAVIGTEFDLPVLEAVLDGTDVLTAIEEAERSRLVAADGSCPERFGFTHILIHRAAYDRPSAARQSRLHYRVGQTLESLAGGDTKPMAALAYHFAAGARSGSTAKAVEYAVAAGRQAMEQLAFEVAGATAERGLRALALEPSPDISRRCELRLLLAEARLYLPDIAGCKDMAGLAGGDARQLGSTEQLVRAAVIGSYLIIFGQPNEITTRLCQDALAALEEDDWTPRALVLAGSANQVTFTEGDSLRAELFSGRAVAAARRSGDVTAMSRALFVHGEVLGWSERIEDRLTISQELTALGRQHDDPRVEASGHHLSALARLESGDLAGFDTDMARVEALRHTIGYWYLGMFVDLWKGMRAMLDGRLSEVEPLAEALLARVNDDPTAFSLYIGQLGWLRRDQGRLAEMRPWVLNAVDANPNVVGFRAGLALIHAELGELEPAAQLLDGVAADGFSGLSRDVSWTLCLASFAEVAAVLGDEPRAQALTELLLPRAGHIIVAAKGMACLGAADRFLGMLAGACGDWASAESWYGSALRVETSAGFTTLAARTRIAYARTLLQRNDPGDRDRATDLAREASDDLASTEMAGLGPCLVALPW